MGLVTERPRSSDPTERPRPWSHAAPNSPSSGALCVLTDEFAGRAGCAAGRRRLRHGLVDRAGGARAGVRLQDEGRRRLVHHHQARRQRQGRRRALGGRGDRRADHPRRHGRAHRGLRGLRGQVVRLAHARQGQHRRADGEDEAGGRRPREAGAYAPPASALGGAASTPPPPPTHACAPCTRRPFRAAWTRARRHAARTSPCSRSPSTPPPPRRVLASSLGYPRRPR